MTIPEYYKKWKHKRPIRPKDLRMAYLEGTLDGKRQADAEIRRLEREVSGLQGKARGFEKAFLIAAHNLARVTGNTTARAFWIDPLRAKLGD